MDIGKKLFCDPPWRKTIFRTFLNRTGSFVGLLVRFGLRKLHFLSLFFSQFYFFGTEHPVIKPLLRLSHMQPALAILLLIASTGLKFIRFSDLVVI